MVSVCVCVSALGDGELVLSLYPLLQKTTAYLGASRSALVQNICGAKDAPDQPLS